MPKKGRKMPPLGEKHAAALVAGSRKYWADASNRKTVSDKRIAENNPFWKGDKVGMKALHQWVIRRMPKPEFCEMCHIEPPRDLANKGVYDRNFENWEYLCRRCHMKSDGRLDALKINGLKRWKNKKLST